MEQTVIPNNIEGANRLAKQAKADAKLHKQLQSVKELVKCEVCGYNYIYSKSPLTSQVQPDGSKVYICRNCGG